MNVVILAAATWLHLLATVTVIGVYLVMFWAVTPIAIATPAHGSLVYESYRRTKPLVLISWGLFIVTGIALMLLNPSYKGIGRFDNLWSILMLVKHVVVLVVVMLSGMINCCPFIGLMRPLDSALKHDDASKTQAVLKDIYSRERVTVLLGVLVLLLTAAGALA
jgi:uncharacterized membrane protein